MFIFFRYIFICSPNSKLSIQYNWPSKYVEFDISGLRRLPRHSLIEYLYLFNVHFAQNRIIKCYIIILETTIHVR